MVNLRLIIDHNDSSTSLLDPGIMADGQVRLRAYITDNLLI